MKKNKGWPMEPARHALAAKGVKTKGHRPQAKKTGRLTLKPMMWLRLQQPATFWSKSYKVTMNPGEKVKYIGVRHSDMAFDVGLGEDMFLAAATKEKIWNHGDLDFHVLFEEA